VFGFLCLLKGVGMLITNNTGMGLYFKDMDWRWFSSMYSFRVSLVWAHNAESDMRVGAAAFYAGELSLLFGLYWFWRTRHRNVWLSCFSPG